MLLEDYGFKEEGRAAEHKQIKVLKLVEAHDWWVTVDYGDGTKAGAYLEEHPVMAFAWCAVLLARDRLCDVMFEMLPVFQNFAGTGIGEYGKPYNSDYADQGTLVGMYRGKGNLVMPREEEIWK